MHHTIQKESEDVTMAYQLRTYHAPDFTETLFQNAPNAVLKAAPRDGVAPEFYHATTIFPEYFKIDGSWILAKESRMDSVAVWEDQTIKILEFRNLHAGDLVVVGRMEDASEGIFVHTDGFIYPNDHNNDSFTFRTGRSRETAYSMDYDELFNLLKHEKEHGTTVFVTGPACTFDSDSRDALSSLIESGYVDALLAGNALATHDLEAGYYNTALGQDIYTQESKIGGHYHHIDTINRVRACGSIAKFIETYQIEDGIMKSLVSNQIPYVLAGSIRDDGPLPEVYSDAYTAQDAMRDLIRNATTVICVATTLHSIAVGNMTPSYRVVNGVVRPVFLYSIDISEFSVNKLRDRGSLAVKTIITNAQDFMVILKKGLVG